MLREESQSRERWDWESFSGVSTDAGGDRRLKALHAMPH